MWEDSDAGHISRSGRWPWRTRRWPSFFSGLKTSPDYRYSAFNTIVTTQMSERRNTVYSGYLDPVRRAARTMNRVPPLRHDAFDPELAGMLKDQGTVFVVQVLVIFMDAPDHAAVLGHRVVGPILLRGHRCLRSRDAMTPPTRCRGVTNSLRGRPL